MWRTSTNRSTRHTAAAAAAAAAVNALLMLVRGGAVFYALTPASTKDGTKKLSWHLNVSPNLTPDQVGILSGSIDLYYFM